MTVEIVLVRHAQTEANAAGIWQGQADSDFSPVGADQVARLRKWLSGESFDRVIVSPLGRTRATARAIIGAAFEMDDRWREPSVGEWEGMGYKEIAALEPQKYFALMSGENVLLDDEFLTDVAHRTKEAFDDIVDAASDGDRVLIVSHALALLMFTSVVLGNPKQGSLGIQANTGVTRVFFDGGHTEISSYNDTGHLDPLVPSVRDGDSQIVLVRHGETESNLEGRWQGQSDGVLSREGHEQARRLGELGLRLDAVYSSPLGRARATALQLVTEADELRIVDDVQELDFGAWQNMRSVDIAAQFPDEWDLLRNQNRDIPRGGTGETFADVQKRVAVAVDHIAHGHVGESVAVVSHGGASRAFALGVLGQGYAERRRLALLGNTAYARFIYTPRGPQLASWNSAPHLR